MAAIGIQGLRLPTMLMNMWKMMMMMRFIRYWPTLRVFCIRLNCYCFCYIYTHGDYEESKETGCSHTHTNALRRSHSRTLPNGRLTAQIMRLLCRPLLLTLLNHLHRTLDFTALRFFDTLEAEKYVFCLCSANGVTVHRWAKNHL